MNLKTTLALLVLAAAGGALLFFGVKLPARVDPAPAPAAAVADAGTRADLHSITPEALTRVEVRGTNGVTVLRRLPGGEWGLPGGWPTRPAEVNALLDQLGNLRSRFVPQPADDLAKYGLDKPPVTVFVELGDRKHTLEFGEPREPGEANRASRETYLRMDSRPEVVRLGPGVLAALDRRTDYYQQRRLFPFERVAKEDNKQEKVERLAAKGLAVEEKKADKKPEGTRFALANDDARGWRLSAPVSERLEPRARESLLAAVPDVWAEHFVTAAPEATGLAAPERTVEVTRGDGTKVMLLVGNVSSTRSRKVMRPAPPGSGLPPREEVVQDEYRYAKLKDNDQVFEVRADKLKDVFVAPDTLRDPQVARFKSEDARRLVIEQGGQSIELAKDGDRWKLVRPVKADADTAKVSELLSKLSLLEARDKDVIDNAKPEQYGLDKPDAVVTVTVEEETGEGEARTKKPRTLAVRVGKHDAAAKKLYVQAEGWPRVSAVEDGLLALATRPALAYRGKRVLDFAAGDVATVSLRNGAKVVGLKQEKGAWKLTAPVAADADADKAGSLASGLGALEAQEFVADAPPAGELEKSYGLGRSALAATVTFADRAKPSRTLLVGKARGGGKPGYFAKVEDAPSVFAVGDETHGLLERDALALLPLQLWQVPAAEVASVKVQKAGQDEYALTPKDGGYRVGGPFDAAALPATAQPLVNDAAAPSLDSYADAAAKSLTEYGLDKPSLRLTVIDKAGKPHTLLLGKPAPKGGRYAKAGDRTAVGVAGDKLVAAIDRGPLDLLDPVLLSVDAARAERVRAKSGDAALTLERKGEAWRVLDAPGAPYDADVEAVAALTGLLFHLKAERFAAYGPKADRAKYGLDKPSATVTIEIPAAGEKAVSKHTVELGAPADAPAGGRYARVDNGPAVAILGPSAVKELTRTPLDYVNRHVLRFDAGTASFLQRHRGPEVLELAKRDGGWRVVKPADERADDKTVRDLLAQLGDLRAARIAAYPAKDLKEFGLEAPEAIFTVRGPAGAKPAEHLLKVGKVADAASGDRYAVTDSGAAVAVVPGSLAKRLLAEPLAFRDRELAKFADADRLRLERGPRRATFARVDGTWKLTDPLPADAEQESLDELLDSLARLRADELVSEKPAADDLKAYGLDKPEARWSLLAGDRQLLTLLVGDPEKGGPRRYAKLAGRDLVFLLEPKLSARVLDEFRTRGVWDAAPDAVSVESVRFGWSRNPFALEKADGTWRVTGKPEVSVNAGTVSDTLAALAGLKLVRYAVDKGADLKLFGLDQPELTVEVATRDGKKTLQIGNTEGGSKRRYARVPAGDRNDVFVLSESDSARILRDLAAFTRPTEVPSPAAGR